MIDGQDKGLLVDKGTPGHDVRPIDGEGSLRAVWQAEITLTDVRVPEENRLPCATSFTGLCSSATSPASYIP